MRDAGRLLDNRTICSRPKVYEAMETDASWLWERVYKGDELVHIRSKSPIVFSWSLLAARLQEQANLFTWVLGELWMGSGSKPAQIWALLSTTLWGDYLRSWSQNESSS